MSKYEITYNKLCYYTIEAKDEAQAIEKLKQTIHPVTEITIEKIENLSMEVSSKKSLDFF
jgi:hypothetical protein